VLSYSSTMRDHQYFADIVHLNIGGATVFTHQLAADIEALGLIPPAGG
jgi:hypothetical protein